MEKFRELIIKLLNVLAGISFIVMVALTVWQVFTRYILNNPSSWSEELVSYMFAWMALLGSSLVTAERGHMNIPILVEKASPNVQKLIECFQELIAFIFSAVILVYGGIQITNLAMGQMTSSLGLAVGYFYIVLPLSGILNMIFTILNIIDIYKGKERTTE